MRSLTNKVLTEGGGKSSDFLGTLEEFPFQLSRVKCREASKAFIVNYVDFVRKPPLYTHVRVCMAGVSRRSDVVASLRAVASTSTSTAQVFRSFPGLVGNRPPLAVPQLRLTSSVVCRPTNKTFRRRFLFLKFSCVQCSPHPLSNRSHQVFPVTFCRRTTLSKESLPIVSR